jgi:hypothetical protein
MIKYYDEIFAAVTFPPSVFCGEDDMSELMQPPVNLVLAHNQVLRCQFRKGRMIPFVPLCRLLKKCKRPTRAAPLVAMRAKERVKSRISSMALDPAEMEFAKKAFDGE